MESAVDLSAGVCTIQEAARFLSIGVSTLYAMMSRGEIATVTVGFARRIPRAELTSYLERNLHKEWTPGRSPAHR